MTIDASYPRVTVKIRERDGRTWELSVPGTWTAHAAEDAADLDCIDLRVNGAMGDATCDLCGMTLDPTSEDVMRVIVPSTPNDSETRRRSFCSIDHLFDWMHLRMHRPRSGDG